MLISLCLALKIRFSDYTSTLCKYPFIRDNLYKYPLKRDKGQTHSPTQSHLSQDEKISISTKSSFLSFRIRLWSQALDNHQSALSPSLDRVSLPRKFARREHAAALLWLRLPSRRVMGPTLSHAAECVSRLVFPVLVGALLSEYPVQYLFSCFRAAHPACSVKLCSHALPICKELQLGCKNSSYFFLKTGFLPNVWSRSPVQGLPFHSLNDASQKT